MPQSETTLSLNDQQYVGTGSVLERLQLERHIRKLITEGRFTIDYIFNYVVSMGYQYSDAKNIFKKITGINPDLIIINNEYYDSPGNIPGYTIGWGFAKNTKDAETYFIQPCGKMYVIHKQKDYKRDCYNKYISIDEAFEELKKLVKKVYTLDVIVNEKLLKEEYNNFEESSSHPAVPFSNPSSPLEELKQDYMGDLVSKASTIIDIKPDKFVTEYWKSFYKDSPSIFWINLKRIMQEHYDWNAGKIKLNNDDISRIKGVLKAVKDLGIEQEYRRIFKGLGNVKLSSYILNEIKNSYLNNFITKAKLEENISSLLNDMKVGISEVNDFYNEINYIDEHRDINNINSKIKINKAIVSNKKQDIDFIAKELLQGGKRFLSYKTSALTGNAVDVIAGFDWDNLINGYKIVSAVANLGGGDYRYLNTEEIGILEEMIFSDLNNKDFINVRNSILKKESYKLEDTDTASFRFNINLSEDDNPSDVKSLLVNELDLDPNKVITITNGVIVDVPSSNHRDARILIDKILGKYGLKKESYKVIFAGKHIKSYEEYEEDEDLKSIKEDVVYIYNNIEKIYEKDKDIEDKFEVYLLNNLSKYSLDMINLVISSFLSGDLDFNLIEFEENKQQIFDIFNEGYILSKKFIKEKYGYVNAVMKKHIRAQDDITTTEDKPILQEPEKELEEKKDEALDDVSDEMFLSRTPQEFFEKDVTNEEKEDIIAYAKTAVEVINKKSEEINEYDVNIKKYEFTNIDKEGVNGYIVSFILNINPKTIKDNVKSVLTVFSFSEGNLSWDATIKDKNGNVYALGKEGLDELFKEDIKDLEKQEEINPNKDNT